MPARGGAAPGRKGARLEARVVADQERMGRIAYRVRQGQGCIVDVIAVEPCHDTDCSVNGAEVTHTFLIQAKATGRLPAAERGRLVAEAGKVHAIPLLAWREGGTVAYERLKA